MSNETLDDKLTTGTVKYGGSLTIWGCLSWNVVGNLVEIDGIMSENSYIDILKENLEESFLKMDLLGNIFQQVQ